MDSCTGSTAPASTLRKTRGTDGESASARNSAASRRTSPGERRPAKAVPAAYAHVRNYGQSCNAPSRMIVPLSSEEVAALQKESADKTKARSRRAETNIGQPVSRIQ